MRFPRLTDAAVGVALVLFPLAARAHEVTHPAPDTRIVSNDNRHPAGTLRNGVLTVQIDARDGTGCRMDPRVTTTPSPRSAKPGRRATTPGPVLRVPLGAEVRATVRNTLGKTLWMYGLGAKRGIASDSVAIAPGASHEFRFRPDAPGIFYYAGRTVAPVVRCAHARRQPATGRARRGQRGCAARPDLPDLQLVRVSRYDDGERRRPSLEAVVQRAFVAQHRTARSRAGRHCALALRQRERAGASAAPARLLLSRRLARGRRARQHDRGGRPPAHGDRARGAGRDDVDDVGADAQRELDLPLPCGGPHLHRGGTGDGPTDAEERSDESRAHAGLRSAQAHERPRAGNPRRLAWRGAAGVDDAGRSGRSGSSCGRARRCMATTSATRTCSAALRPRQPPTRCPYRGPCCRSCEESQWR